MHTRAASSLLESQIPRIDTLGRSRTESVARLQAHGGVLEVGQRTPKIRAAPAIRAFTSWCLGARKGRVRDGPAKAKRAQARRALPRTADDA